MAGRGKKREGGRERGRERGRGVGTGTEYLSGRERGGVCEWSEAKGGGGDVCCYRSFFKFSLRVQPFIKHSSFVAAAAAVAVAVVVVLAVVVV